MDELKRCPHCDYEVKVLASDDPKIGEGWYVKCTGCGVRIGGATHTQEEAIKKWNRMVGYM